VPVGEVVAALASVGAVGVDADRGDPGGDGEAELPGVAERGGHVGRRGGGRRERDQAEDEAKAMRARCWRCIVKSYFLIFRARARQAARFLVFLVDWQAATASARL
jgi:hypothetical protein